MQNFSFISTINQWIPNLQKPQPGFVVVVVYLFVLFSDEEVDSERVCVYTHMHVNNPSRDIGYTLLFSHILMRATDPKFRPLNHSQKCDSETQPLQQPSQCMFTSDCVSWGACHGVCDFGTQNRVPTQKPYWKTPKSHGQKPRVIYRCG